jgi:isocitrate dehydrogenase kinase/phosphatase
MPSVPCKHFATDVVRVGAVMAAKRRHDQSQDEKRITFAAMAKTYEECIAAANFIAAHVIAFSYLEDRVTAMDIVLGRANGASRNGHDQIANRVKRLKAAGDLPAKLTDHILDAAKTRNALFHAAMWNLSVFSAENAKEVLSLGRDVDNARKRQKTKRKQ